MKSRRIPPKVKTKNNRFTHPIGAFTPTSPMVTEKRKIPLAAEIRAAAARARAASQSSSSSSSSGPSPKEFYNYRKEMEKNQNQMQFDMEPPAAAPAPAPAPAATMPSGLYSPLLVSSSKYTGDAPKKEKQSYKLRELSLSPLTTFNTNDRTGLNYDEKEYLKSIAKKHNMEYPGKGISPVSGLPVQNKNRNRFHYTEYYPFIDKTERANYKINTEAYMNVLKLQNELNEERDAAAAGAAAAADEQSMFKVPTARSLDAWDKDSDDTTFPIDGGKRRRRKTKRKIRKTKRRRRKTKRRRKSKRIKRKTKRRRKSSFSKTKRRKK